MFDLFIGFLSVAAYFALHVVLVMALICFSLKVNQWVESYKKRQRKKAFEIILDPNKR